MSRMRMTSISTAIAVTALMIIGCGSTSHSDDDKSISHAAGTTPTARMKTPVLKASDIKLAVKVTKKDCFGSAGCYIDFTVVPTIADTASVGMGGEDVTWLVTYTVKGPSDAMVDTFSMGGDGRYDGSDMVHSGVDTPNPPKLSATVTAVEVG